MDDNTSNKGIVGSVSQWLAQPFNTTGSAFNWVLFVGLLIIAAWFWTMVLHDIT